MEDTHTGLICMHKQTIKPAKTFILDEMWI